MDDLQTITLHSHEFDAHSNAWLNGGEKDPARDRFFQRARKFMWQLGDRTQGVFRFERLTCAPEDAARASRYETLQVSQGDNELLVMAIQGPHKLLEAQFAQARNPQYSRLLNASEAAQWVSKKLGVWTQSESAHRRYRSWYFDPHLSLSQSLMFLVDYLQRLKGEYRVEVINFDLGEFNKIQLVVRNEDPTGGHLYFQAQAPTGKINKS